MKVLAVIALSVFSLHSHGQRFVEAMQSYQSEVKTSNKKNIEKTSAPIVTQVKSSGQCFEKDQSSLPLAYLPELNILHDPRSGSLSVSSGEMIGNCISMIELKPGSKVIAGKTVYTLEAKIKQGKDCAEGLCTYQVAKVEDKNFKDFEAMKLKPTLAGFEECLEKSGAVAGNQSVPSAVYPATISEKFEGFKETGDLLFVSRGPSSKLIKAKHGNFVEIDECDHYEKISNDGLTLLSQEDEDHQRIISEKEKVKSCGQYDRIADFIEKYEGYADDLNDIRDKLILEATKKSVKAIAAGKYTDEDLKVLADFEKYIVHPKINRARTTYNEMAELEGEAKKARQADLEKLLVELKALNSAPYITEPIVVKLENDGQFDEAEKANQIKSLLVSHANLGKKIEGVIITPEVALLRSTNLMKSYAAELDDKREKYEIRTGQSSGQSKYYSHLGSRMNENIRIRTENYSREISEEYARIQPGGYCYRYFRNTQRCIQESMERIQDLQAQMQHFNKVDAERADEYWVKAEEYGKLEAEGRRYIAAQSGEEPTTEAAEADTTSPGRRSEGYTFNFQPNYQPSMQQPQMMNPMSQQNIYQQGNPYMQQPYANPYLGQQGYNYRPNNGFQFGGQLHLGTQAYNGFGNQQFGGQQFGGQPFGGQQFGYGAQYAQQPQQGYWNTPHQAYSNFNMWNR
jgi:hypothetical protein